MTTEQHDQDFATVAWIIRQGSSSWVGPTPNAGGARWAAKAARQPVLRFSTGLLWGAAFTGLVFVIVLAIAASMTPGGLMSVPRRVSDVLSQRAPRGPAGPAASPSVGPLRVGPQPGAASPLTTASPAVKNPTPTPVEGEDHGGGGGGGRGPSSGPGPGVSPTPDS
jgi:hypothetical protein